MSDHRRIPTHAEIARLTSRVRDGRLDDEQREQLAQLLNTISSAVRVAPTVAARYPGQPERAAAAALGCWDAVPGTYAALLEGGQRQRIDHGGSGCAVPAGLPSRNRKPAQPGRGACHGRPRTVPNMTDTGATAVAPAIHRGER